jgi:hypothetical protein
MVKAARLKPPLCVSMQSLEGPFPKCDPTLDREVFIDRRAEEMEMIGHQDGPTNHPGVSQLPAGDYLARDRWIRQPAAASLSGNGEENKRGLPAKNEHPGRWFTTPGPRGIGRHRYEIVASEPIGRWYFGKR